MSSPQRSSKSQKSGFGRQTPFMFMPNVSFESLIYIAVQSYLTAPTLIGETGDATRILSIQSAIVTSFDAFVNGVLSAKGRIEPYATERQKLIDEWTALDKNDLLGRSQIAARIFKLTIQTLSKKRLFKVRQYALFGINERIPKPNETGDTPDSIADKEDEFAQDE